MRPGRQRGIDVATASNWATFLTDGSFFSLPHRRSVEARKRVEVLASFLPIRRTTTRLCVLHHLAKWSDTLSIFLPFSPPLLYVSSWFLHFLAFFEFNAFLLSVAFSCFQLLSVAFSCFQLLSAAFSCFQLLPVASSCFRLVLLLYFFPPIYHRYSSAFFSFSLWLSFPSSTFVSLSLSLSFSLSLSLSLLFFLPSPLHNFISQSKKTNEMQLQFTLWLDWK